MARALRYSETSLLWSVFRLTQMLGCTHAEVGAYLLGLWGLSDQVTIAVAWHHRPAASGTTTLTPLALVHAADAIAQADQRMAAAADRVRQAEAAAAARVSVRLAPGRGFTAAANETAGDAGGRAVADGSHTVTAKLTLTDNTVVISHATFIVANSGPTVRIASDPSQPRLPALRSRHCGRSGSEPWGQRGESSGRN